MSIRENILQGMRAFCRAATGLPDGSVLVAQVGMIRPVMPYLTVQAILLGAAVGTDELLRDLDGVGGDGYPDGSMREWVRGHRRATVQVSGYGTASLDLLEQVRMAVELPSARAAAGACGISIAGAEDTKDLTLLRDTAFEMAGELDLVVSYRLDTVPAAAISAEHIEIEVTQAGTPPPADLAFTLIVDTEP
jgi:hypothetical protein